MTWKEIVPIPFLLWTDDVNRTHSLMMKGTGSFSKLFTISCSGYPDHFRLHLQSWIKDVQSSDQWPAAVFPHSFQASQQSPAYITSLVKLDFLLDPTGLSLTPDALPPPTWFPFPGLFAAPDTLQSTPIPPRLPATSYQPLQKSGVPFSHILEPSGYEQLRS